MKKGNPRSPKTPKNNRGIRKEEPAIQAGFYYMSVARSSISEQSRGRRNAGWGTVSPGAHGIIKVD